MDDSYPRTEVLTQVDRLYLYPEPWDSCLIDKDDYPYRVICGAIGLILGAILLSADLLVIPTIILCVWFGAMLFTGYPRMLEP